MRVYALKDTLQASFGGEWGNDCILGEGVAVLRTTNFTNTGNISYCNVVERDIADGKVQKKKLRVGDIILEKSGGTKNTPVGRVVYFDRSDKIYLCNNFTQVLRPNLQIVDGKYLFYCLYAKYQFHVTDGLYNKTTGIQNLQMDRYFNLQIPVVDKEQQYKICKQLDALRAAIEKKKQVLRKFEDLVKSQFIEMFGDPNLNSKSLPTNAMTEVCDIIDGDRGVNYPKQEEFTSDGYCLFLSAKNVTKEGFLFEECIFISKEKDHILRNGKLTRGDVVLTTRGTIGNLAFYTDCVPYQNVRINSGMVILRMRSTILNEQFFIQQFRLQLDEIKRKIASGSAQPQLPISTMKKIKMLLPPIELQNQFAAFVEQTDKSKFRIKQSLEKLEKCYKALLQKYFG